LNRKDALALMVVGMIVALLVTGCRSQTPASPEPEKGSENQMKVAFVYNAQVGDYGWFYRHDVARKELEQALDYVETIALENVAPGAEAERVLRELASTGFETIVAASADYEADVAKIATDFPDVKFLICAGTIAQEPNVESFFPKAYQLWYVMGKLAGYMTKTNTLGMIGAIVHPLDLQVQNAFALGAQSVNPEAVLRIVYINTYYDPAAEKDAALSLIDAGADVLAQCTNSPAHVQAAEEEGVYALSMWADMSQFGPNAFLSGDLYDWKEYYIPTIEAIRAGTWKPTIKAPDIDAGWIKMADFGPAVPEEVRETVLQELEKMMKREVDPDFFWTGPIYDNTGKTVVPEGYRPTDEDLLAMDWWVKGVITSMSQ